MNDERVHSIHTDRVFSHLKIIDFTSQREFVQRMAANLEASHCAHRRAIIYPIYRGNGVKGHTWGCRWSVQGWVQKKLIALFDVGAISGWHKPIIARHTKDTTVESCSELLTNVIICCCFVLHWAAFYWSLNMGHFTFCFVWSLSQELAIVLLELQYEMQQP